VIQLRLIESVRARCLEDARLDAALMYGSFAEGTGDTHSDIEFWLFFTDPAVVDAAEWCESVAPLRHLVVNEYGAHVAFFPDLVRGEFHFASREDIASVAGWPARGAPVSRMLVVDRRGELGRVLGGLPSAPAAPGSAEVEVLCGRYANWLVLARNVAARGELLRAVDALGQVQRHLLWLSRLASDETGHWLTPSRGAEAEVPPAALASLRRALPEADRVDAALAGAWAAGKALWLRLADRYGFAVPYALFDDLDASLR